MTLAVIARPDNCPTCGQKVTTDIGFKYDQAAQVIIANGSVLRLGKGEYEVLFKMLNRFGQCVEASDLIDAAYGRYKPSHGRKSLNIIMFKLRTKLADTGLAIVTYRDSGYAITNSGTPMFARHIGRGGG